MNLKQKSLFSDDCDNYMSLESDKSVSFKKPLYPPAPDFYKMCPHHKSCPGFTSNLINSRPNIIYCHYLQCPDLLSVLPHEYLKMASGSSGTVHKLFSESPELLPTDDDWSTDL